MMERTILLTMHDDGWWAVKDKNMPEINAFASATDALEHALNVRPDEAPWA